MPLSSPSVQSRTGCCRLPAAQQSDRNLASRATPLRLLRPSRCAQLLAAGLVPLPALSHNGLVEQCTAGCREGLDASQGNREEGPGKSRLRALPGCQRPQRRWIAACELLIAAGRPEQLLGLPPPPPALFAATLLPHACTVSLPARACPPLQAGGGGGHGRGGQP